MRDGVPPVFYLEETVRLKLDQVPTRCPTVQVYKVRVQTPVTTYPVHMGQWIPGTNQNLNRPC
jgi:hypothetical protein